MHRLHAGRQQKQVLQTHSSPNEAGFASQEPSPEQDIEICLSDEEDAAEVRTYVFIFLAQAEDNAILALELHPWD